MMECLSYNMESYSQKAQRYMNIPGYKDGTYHETLEDMNEIRDRFVDARAIMREKRKGVIKAARVMKP